MRRHLRGPLCAVVIGVVAPLVTVGGLEAAPAPDIDIEQPPKADPDPQVVESETGSYIVVMVDDPLIATIAPEDLDTARARSEAAALEADHDAVLAESGISTTEKVQDFTNALNGFSATLSHRQAVKVASNPAVALVVPDELRQLTTDSSGEFLGLTGRGRAYASGLTGEGVVIGVIDSGIWPEHPSFADDGSYPPPPVTLVDTPSRPACEFGNTAHNPADVPFACNNKLIGARQMLDSYRTVIGADPDEFDSARDDDGHGTHTAGTAGGNAGVAASIFGHDLGTITGIAPRAHIIAYKGLGNLGGFTSDLTAAIDQAVEDGVDVINYSVGGGPGLVSPDTIAYLFAADAGVWVATSAGNSGPGPETIGGPADVPWLTTVAASTQERFFEGTVSLTHGRLPRFEDAPEQAAALGFPGIGGGRLNHLQWWIWYQRFLQWWQWWIKHNTTTVVGASVTGEITERTPIVDAEHAGGDLCLPGTLDPALVAGNIVLCRRGAIGRAAKGLAVFEAGGAGMVLYNNTDSDNLFTDNHWVPAVHVDHTVGLEVKHYIADHDHPMATITGTATPTEIDYAPSTTYFSSRGPNPSTADIIKPDITAPGLQILAAASPFPDPGSNPPGELFQAISGTSMSSPHIAGFYAVLRQAHPDWTPAMARSAIMTTAHQDVRDSDRVSPADPFDMGAGHLDPGKVAARGSSFNPGLVYDAGFLDYLGFLCDAGPEIFANPGATCAALAAAGIPTDASDLNYPSIGVGELAGTQTVTRTITSVADRSVRWRAQVEAPPGYDVTVSPSTIDLAPGASATYEVTIANNGGGTVGEWRFGSLTWRGSGGHEARSPIAVRGAAILAPESITATGTAGTASFDVTFGYTGDYAAAAHGPVAPTVHAGDISQDPDQVYPSADDGAGVDRIPITLSGAAFARWELVIPGDDDIDLYLEDADGNVVAESTSGGTDELIELVTPPDGEYTMVVHGWAVPSEPLPYDLLEWVVSATPGGDLVIDAAPTAAVAGTTATIDVSWSGLAAGVRHLGAVSHSDGSGLLALTLVEIDT